MPEPRKSKSAPPTQGQAQAQTQEAQEITPAVLEALFGEGGNEDEQGGPPADDDADTNGSFLETLRRLTRQSSFVIIPLLFAIVTFLLAVLVFAVRGPHNFPLVELWAIGLIALAMAILQGMMLYYAGSDSGLWFLGILVGFVLFPPVLFFALDGPLASLITIVVMLVVCGVIVWLCKALVQDGHVGIVYSLGKYRRTLLPGMNFLPPWERMVRLLDTHEKLWTCQPQTVPMSPTVDLELAATISYEIIPEEAHQIALHVDQWEQQLQNLFRINLQHIAAEFQPEDFYPWHGTTRQRASGEGDAGSSKGKAPTWSRMNTRLFQLMRDQVAPWGVQINSVSIHDVSPRPHDSFPQGAVGTTGTASTRAAPSSRPGPTRTTPTAPRPDGAIAKPQPRPQPTTNATAPTATSATAPAEPPATTNNKKFDALINSYNEVRAGHITDPETIRRLAGAFDAIAHNPVESQAFPFDAALAASNLYARAQHREEQISASAEFPSYQGGTNDEYEEYDEDSEDNEDSENDEDDEDMNGQTQPDWLNPLPPDDGFIGG